MDVQEKSLKYRGGRIRLPYEINYSYTCEKGGTCGVAEIIFQPSEIKVYGETPCSVCRLPNIRQSINVNGRTRKANKRFVKNKMWQRGKSIVDKIVDEEIIVLSK